MKCSNFARGSWRSSMGMIGAATLALVCGTPGSALAQDSKPAAVAQPSEKLPDGAAVHASYIKALGGEEVLKGVKSRISTAKLEMPGGMTAKLDSYQAGGSMYVLMDLTGFGKVESGLTEGICWQRDPARGSQIMTGPEKDQLVREADLQNDLNVSKYFTKLETVGTAEVDGKNCYKVEYTPTSGEKQTRYFDVESGLLVKIESVQEMQGGKQPVSATISDYREVDGIMVSYKMTQSAMGASSSIIYETIAFNKDVPEDKLKTPADIKALAEKKKAAAEAPAAEPKKEEPKKPEAPR